MPLCVLGRVFDPVYADLRLANRKREIQQRTPSHEPFFRLALLILTVGTMMTGIASAANYYVAANGSDSNSGTSNTSPWLHAPVCRTALEPAPPLRFVLEIRSSYGAAIPGMWEIRLPVPTREEPGMFRHRAVPET